MSVDVPDHAPVCVFDLDDTLVRSPLDLRAMARDMQTQAAKLGLPAPSLERRTSVVEWLNIARASDPAYEATLLAIAREHEHGAMHHATAEPGAREAVAGVRAAGYHTAVWTNNTRLVADHVLGRLKFIQHVDMVVTRDESILLKPDPAGLRLIQQRWPAASSHVVVGDAWIEGIAAAVLGVPFVAYRANREVMRDRGVQPAAWLEAFEDLPATLAAVRR